jgi:predicted RNA-binding protein with PUA-like domain
VGVASVVSEAKPEETDDDGEWSAVELAPRKALSKPVTLAQIKADPKLADFKLVRQSRLSVVPATAAEFARVLALSETTL